MTRFASWRRRQCSTTGHRPDRGAGCSAWAPRGSRASSSVRGLLAACGGDDSGGSAGGTSGGAGGGGNGGGGNGTLNLFTWAEYHSQELLDKFGKVTVTVFNSNEEAIAKLQASGGTSGFDLIIPTGVYIPQMASDGLIDTLDTSKLANFGNVDPIYLGQTWDPDNKYSVPKDWGSTGWIYDNTVITEPLETWSDFLAAAKVRRAARRRCSTPPRTSRVSTSGPTASTGRRPSRRSSTRARTTSSTRSRRTSRRSTRTRASTSRPGNYVLSQVWNGDARQGLLRRSTTPTSTRGALGAPTTELWMDNW